MKMFTEAEVVRQLKRAARELGSQVALAEAAGVSPQFLTDVLKRRRSPSGPLLAYLKLKKCNAMYEPEA